MILISNTSNTLYIRVRLLSIKSNFYLGVRGMVRQTVNILSELSDKGISLFLGGVGPQLDIESFNSNEEALLEKFLDESEAYLRTVNNDLANIFVEHRDLIVFLAQHFKARTNKTFGGDQPGTSDFGIALIAPWLINWDGAQPTAYNGHDWIVSTTAGTPLYLLGSATAYYRARSDVNYRMMHIILQNGIFAYGTTPAISQIQVMSEKVTQVPFHVMPVNDKPIERHPLYILKTPYAIPVWFDMGVKIVLLPYRSQPELDIRLLGVTFYEYNAWRALAYP